eukprot:TRINITY_DN1708_c0_g2_i2.p1 TRINITY_DN1708_c0_g2~~TRINITY_DN1708_c0_g2_i2.p1  ORF type:complete len:315 (-),score=33.92 TRINITY_DN1708_c0_g2_i2:230-1174(-)
MPLFIRRLNNLFSWKEIKFPLKSGIKLSAKSWGNDVNPEVKILALHGFLDNCATWDKMAPLLVERGQGKVQIVAIDDAGHGQSDHRPGGFYSYLESTFDTVEVIEQLNWKNMFLLGHSRGGNIGLLTASALAKDKIIDKLFIVDVLGPSTKPDNQTLENLRNCIKSRPQQFTRKPREYDSLDQIVDRMVESNKFLERESALLLAQRGTKQTNTGEKSVIQFSHDMHLSMQFPSTVVWSDRQMKDIFHNVLCPVYIIWSSAEKRNWRFDEEALFQRLTWFPDRSLITLKKVDGSHHVHIDDAPLIVEDVAKFFGI